MSFFFFFSSLSVFGQWSPVDSGTASNRRRYSPDSGTGFVVGDTGTILKTTDAERLGCRSSGTSVTLHALFLIPMKESLSATAAPFSTRLTEAHLAKRCGRER
jgi:hypothetical protein